LLSCAFIPARHSNTLGVARTSSTDADSLGGIGVAKGGAGCRCGGEYFHVWLTEKASDQGLATPMLSVSFDLHRALIAAHQVPVGAWRIKTNPAMRDKLCMISITTLAHRRR
jgi:hypothetical protein